MPISHRKKSRKLTDRNVGEPQPNNFITDQLQLSYIPKDNADRVRTFLTQSELGNWKSTSRSQKLVVEQFPNYCAHDSKDDCEYCDVEQKYSQHRPRCDAKCSSTKEQCKRYCVPIYTKSNFNRRNKWHKRWEKRLGTFFMCSQHQQLWFNDKTPIALVLNKSVLECSRRDLESVEVQSLRNVLIATMTRLNITTLGEARTQFCPVGIYNPHLLLQSADNLPVNSDRLLLNLSLLLQAPYGREPKFVRVYRKTMRKLSTLKHT